MASAGVGYGGYARVSLWILNNLMKQDPSLNLWLDLHTTGTRFRQGLLLLADKKADIVLVNSQGLANMAVRGRGLFNRPIPLRGIANLGSGEWATFAIDAKWGIRSFADLKEKKPPLKIVTGDRDDSATGFLVMELLKRHGIDPEEFRSWGGEFIHGGAGGFAMEQLSSGRADAVFQEAIIGEPAIQLFRRRPMTFLSVDSNVAKQLEEEYGWPFVTVPANEYPNQNAPFLAPNFADWLIGVRDDMEEALAYRLAQIVVEQRDDLDQTKSYGSVVFSPFAAYSLDPKEVSKMSIPLHPGAARYYREKALQ
jgi:TRAP transporter TAXI family solute receptor